MAVLASSGLWLFVMLTAAVNGFPTKNALDLHRGSDAPPASGWGVPPSGFSQTDSVFSPPSNPAFYEQPTYSQASAEIGPDVYPVYSEHDGSSQSSESNPGFQVAPFQNTWAVPPPSPFYHGVSSPAELGFAFKPEPPVYMSPPGPFLQPQPGELSYEEMSYEHGNYNSETEEENPPTLPLQYFPVPALSRFPNSSPLALAALLDTLKFGYPYVDYMLLTRNHPPGTYTFSTNDFQHGKNQWHDNHYIGAPGRRPSEQLDTSDPWSMTQPKPAVQQSALDVNYDLIKPV